MSETPSRPSFTHYLPEELGLDERKPEDHELYVASGGIREIGELMLDRRSLVEAYNNGFLTERQYRQLEDRTNRDIAQLWLLHTTGENPRP